MRFFFKLNFVRILYAFVAFVPVELYLNVLRIMRLTGLNRGMVTYLSGVIMIMVIIGGTLSLYRLTEKWLVKRRASFWTGILWVPYFMFFIYAFASLFPDNYGGDDPGPGAGLILIGSLVFYQLYILILNLIGTTTLDD